MVQFFFYYDFLEPFLAFRSLSEAICLVPLGWNTRLIEALVPRVWCLLRRAFVYYLLQPRPNKDMWANARKRFHKFLHAVHVWSTENF